MWKTLNDTNMTKTQKILVNIQWQYANIRRLIHVEHSVIKGVKRWWHLRQICKKANKTLLREAKAVQNRGMKPPPTMEELEQFKQDMGGEAVLNTHYITSVKSKTKNLDMDIHYGN